MKTTYYDYAAIILMLLAFCSMIMESWYLAGILLLIAFILAAKSDFNDNEEIR